MSNIKDGANGSNIGRARYMDINGDGNLNQDDIVYLGNSDPVVYGGIQNNIKLFGNLNIGFFFAYSVGGKIYNLSELYLGSTVSSYNKYRYDKSTYQLMLFKEAEHPRHKYTKEEYHNTQGHTQY